MFNTGLVLHYVKEYTTLEFSNIKKLIKKNIDKGILDSLEHNDSIIDSISENLPIGTTICIDLSETESETVVICFPMFSSHISLPIKPGEMVWFYKDESSTFNGITKNSAPILFVKHYWLSRKIGSRLSEDLNYSHIQRDTLINEKSSEHNKLTGLDSNYNSTGVNEKKRDKIIKNEIHKKIKLPDYENTEVYTKEYSFLPKVSSIYENAKQKNDFYPAPVPRWSSKPYELSLQGSNNSLINLTKTFNTEDFFGNKGAVDIVAGRHIIENYANTAQNIFTIADKFIINEPDISRRKLDRIDFNTNNSFLSIYNINNDPETLKNEKVYFGGEIRNKSSFNEGHYNLENDASRIYISEFDQVDNTSFYNTIRLEEQSILTFNEEKQNEYNKEAFLEVEKSIKFNNLKERSIKAENLLLPSVFIKSNNVRLIARAQKSSLSEGSIRIVKESNSPLSYSHISMEKDGQIAIDGKTLMLGNLKKEMLRQNIISEIDEDLDEDTDILKMKGNGYGLLIGYNENLSEPLVLGNTLESLLKEIIHINIALVEEVKLLTDDLQKHVHLGIPGTGISGPPQIPTPYATFSNTSQKSLKKRYDNIQNNLKEMLSIFAKTS